MKKSGLYLSQKRFKNLDGRLSITKHFRITKNTLIDALGGEISPQQEILIDRCVFLLFRVRTFEALLLQGEGPKIDEYYLSWVNTLRRTLETLGLEKKAKDITLEALLKNGTD